MGKRSTQPTLAAGQESWLVFRYELVEKHPEGGLQFPPGRSRAQVIEVGLRAMADGEEEVLVSQDVFRIAEVREAGPSVLLFKLCRRVTIRQTGRVSRGKLTLLEGPFDKFAKAIVLTAPNEQWILLEEFGDVARSPAVLLKAIRAALATAARAAGGEYVATARIQMEKSAFIDWLASVDHVTVLEFSCMGRNLPAPAGNAHVAQLKAGIEGLLDQIAGKKAVYQIRQPDMTAPVVAALADSVATQELPFVARGSKKRRKPVKFNSEDPNNPHRLYVHAEQSEADKVANLASKLAAYVASQPAMEPDQDGH